MITNQQIKYIRSLQQKKYREEYNSYVAEGNKIIEEVIDKHSSEIELIVCTSRARKQLKIERPPEVKKVIEVSKKDFSRVSGQTTPQESLVVLRKKTPQKSINNIRGELVLALDRVQDPGNFGTILRLADWFGIRDVICSADCVDMYNPKVIQSSMGAFLRITLYYGSLHDMLKDLKEKQKYHLYASSPEGANIYIENFPKKTIFILGNESSGISESILAVSEKRISIPNFSMREDKTESLNVSIAAAIICSEFFRGK